MEKYYTPSEGHTLNDMYYRISDYCSKPLGEHVPQTKTKLTWTFFHAVFFVLTIVSTIGENYLERISIYLLTILGI